MYCVGGYLLGIGAAMIAKYQISTYKYNNLWLSLSFIDMGMIDKQSDPNSILSAYNSLESTTRVAIPEVRRADYWMSQVRSLFETNETVAAAGNDGDGDGEPSLGVNSYVTGQKACHPMHSTAATATAAVTTELTPLTYTTAAANGRHR